MNHSPEAARTEAVVQRPSTVVTPRQQVALGQALCDLAKSFTEDGGDHLEGKAWRRRLRTVLVGAGEFLGQVVLVTGQLRLQAPDNWPTSLAYSVFRAVIEDGFPVLWVPNAQTLTAMAHAPDRASRQQVLLDARDQLLGEARTVLAQVTAPDLASDRQVVEQALACVTDQPAPAQAAALLVAANRAQAETGASSLADLSKRGKAAAERGLFVGVEELRSTLMLTAMAPALEHFYPGTSMPVPTRPNRHAVAHVTSQVQYTPGNALESVLLAVSVLRQAQATRDAAASSSPDTSLTVLTNGAASLGAVAASASS